MGQSSTEIRQLACSRQGDVIAAAQFETVVHLYSLSTLTHINTLETTLDFGGRRLAISDDGRRVVAGAYNAQGIAVYSSDGREIWRRKDLKRVQQIDFNRDGRRLFCSFENNICQSVELESGITVMTLQDVRRVWASPFGPFRLLEQSRDYSIANLDRSIASISRVTFSILSAAFSRTEVCLSETRGPVRAIDISTGVEAWRHTPPIGTHFLRVAFHEMLDAFVGVSLGFEKGGRVLLQRFPSRGGAPEVIAEVGPANDVSFCANGMKLLTNTGSVFDVVSGKRIGVLPFPT